MSQQDKTFIGRCFNGKFQEGTADIKLLIDGEALKQLLDIAKDAKEQKGAGAELPAGVTEYNGNLQINLRVRTNRDGSKSYCELDTWKPDGQKKTQPVAEAEVVEDMEELPF